MGPCANPNRTDRSESRTLFILGMQRCYKYIKGPPTPNEWKSMIGVRVFRNAEATPIWTQTDCSMSNLLAVCTIFEHAGNGVKAHLPLVKYSFLLFPPYICLDQSETRVLISLEDYFNKVL